MFFSFYSLSQNSPIKFLMPAVFGTAVHLFTHKPTLSAHLSAEPLRMKLTTSYKPKYVHQSIDITETK